MILFDQAPFVNRDRFGEFLNKRGLKGMAVEVGTHRGDWAVKFLEQWQGQTLLCVDPYLKNYDPGDSTGFGDREADKLAALKALKPFSDRTLPVYRTSLEMAAVYLDGSLDFVYIDGCHMAQAVREDLNAWWPKIKSGGVLAGHDVVTQGEKGGGWAANVQPEVVRFAIDHGMTIHLVVEMTCRPWSFYFDKP